MEYQEAFLNETSNSPHFSDEDSIRGAQPVVPLAEIRSTRLRNRLLMTLALVFAVGLGAGVALLLVQLKQQRTAGEQSDAKAEASKSAKDEDPTVAAVGEEEEMIDLPPSEDEDSEVQQPDNIPRRKRGPTVRNSDGSARSVVGPQPASNPIKNDDPPRKPILVDQWEEKRSRRVTPNERGRENVRRPDLFRIREIFEGARP